jgi:hypothetical protein
MTRRDDETIRNDEMQGDVTMMRQHDNKPNGRERGEGRGERREGRGERGKGKGERGEVGA